VFTVADLLAMIAINNKLDDSTEEEMWCKFEKYFVAHVSKAGMSAPKTRNILSHASWLCFSTQTHFP
jgi:hypothetical protein